MPEEKEQISCVWCGVLFTPTRANHRFHGNLCVVKAYQSRQKINKLMKQLSTPSQLVALELFAETLIDEAT